MYFEVLEVLSAETCIYETAGFYLWYLQSF